MPIRLKAAPRLLVLALAAGSGHAADNCEPLRAKIEAQIAGTGVTGFSITTVDAAATVTGKVVGSCDNGTKKIVYGRGGAPAAPRPVSPAAVQPAAPAAAKPRPARKGTRDEDILTECKDGSVSMGGNCKN